MQTQFDDLYQATFRAIQAASETVTFTAHPNGTFTTNSGFTTSLIDCTCQLHDPDQYALPMTTPGGHKVYLCCHIMKLAKELLNGCTLKKYQEKVDTIFSPPGSVSIKRNSHPKVQELVNKTLKELREEICLWHALSDRADKVEFVGGQASVEQYRDGLRESVETIPGKRQINGYLVTPTACGCPAAQYETKEGTVRLWDDMRLCKHSIRLRRLLGQNVESLIACLNGHLPGDNKSRGWLR